MLYGSRPYGEGKSQENVWSEGLIFNASQVEFPSDPKAPKVSDEAKDLIRACLTRDHRSRLGFAIHLVIHVVGVKVMLFCFRHLGQM